MIKLPALTNKVMGIWNLSEYIGKKSVDRHQNMKYLPIKMKRRNDREAPT